jgi:hypothetical protein
MHILFCCLYFFCFRRFCTLVVTIKFSAHVTTRNSTGATIGKSYAKISFTTLPLTSVSLNLLPWYL